MSRHRPRTLTALPEPQAQPDGVHHVVELGLSRWLRDPRPPAPVADLLLDPLPHHVAGHLPLPLTRERTDDLGVAEGAEQAPADGGEGEKVAGVALAPGVDLHPFHDEGVGAEPVQDRHRGGFHSTDGGEPLDGAGLSFPRSAGNVPGVQQLSVEPPRAAAAPGSRVDGEQEHAAG